METPPTGGGAAFGWCLVAIGSIPTFSNKPDCNQRAGGEGLNKHSCFQGNTWRAFNYCNYKHAHTALTLMWRRLDIKGRKQQIKAQSWLVGVVSSPTATEQTVISWWGGGVWLFPFTFLAFCWRWPELALLCDAWRPRQDAAGEKCAVTVPSKSTPLGNNSREDGRFWVRISTRTAVCPGARRIIQLLITVNGL